jgi:hypothetical protein
MSDLKNAIQDFLNKMKALEERARKLKNQNLADVAASAYGRIKQLGDHADLHLVDENKDQQTYPDGTLKAGAFDPKAPATREEAIERVRASGIEHPESTARNNWPHLFEPAEDRKTFNPGEPQFDQRNRDFRRPDDVDLNRDGTLQRAPNSLGTAPDIR